MNKNHNPNKVKVIKRCCQNNRMKWVQLDTSRVLLSCLIRKFPVAQFKLKWDLILHFCPAQCFMVALMCRWTLEITITHHFGEIPQHGRWAPLLPLVFLITPTKLQLKVVSSFQQINYSQLFRYQNIFKKNEGIHGNTWQSNVFFF